MSGVLLSRLVTILASDDAFTKIIQGMASYMPKSLIQRVCLHLGTYAESCRA